MVRTTLLLSLPLALVIGCGGAQKTSEAPDICNIAVSSLKQELGPELGKIELKRRSTRTERVAHACLIVYSRVAEELPEELEDGDDLDLEIDHRLAIVVDPDRGAPQFRKIRGSKDSPGSVRVGVLTKDVTGDGIADFVVEERASVKGDALGYRGLRIFEGAPDGRGQEIFSKQLLIQTPEGLRIVPRWTTKSVQGHHLLLLTGGGLENRYRYNRLHRAFQLVKKAPKAAPAKAAPIKLPNPTTSKAPVKIKKPAAKGKKAPANDAAKDPMNEPLNLDL